MISAGIEAATFRFVAQHLNHCATAVPIPLWGRVKSKVKCTLVVQALRLCSGRTPLKGITGIALHFFDHVTRRGEGFSVTPRPHFTPGKDLVPIVHEAEWARGPVWTGAENVAATRIRFRDRLLGRNQVVIRTFSQRGTTNL
jgi:hypothetical protein